MEYKRSKQYYFAQGFIHGETDTHPLILHRPVVFTVPAISFRTTYPPYVIMLSIEKRILGTAVFVRKSTEYVRSSVPHIQCVTAVFRHVCRWASSVTPEINVWHFSLFLPGVSSFSCYHFWRTRNSLQKVSKQGYIQRSIDCQSCRIEHHSCDR